MATQANHPARRQPRHGGIAMPAALMAAQLLSADAGQGGAFVWRAVMRAMFHPIATAAAIHLGLNQQRYMRQTVIMVLQPNLLRHALGALTYRLNGVRRGLAAAAAPRLPLQLCSALQRRGEEIVIGKDHALAVAIILEKIEDAGLLGQPRDEGEIRLLILRYMVALGVGVAVTQAKLMFKAAQIGVTDLGSWTKRAGEFSLDHIGNRHRIRRAVDLVGSGEFETRQPGHQPKTVTRIAEY